MTSGPRKRGRKEPHNPYLIRLGDGKVMDMTPRAEKEKEKEPAAAAAAAAAAAGGCGKVASPSGQETGARQDKGRPAAASASHRGRGGKAAGRPDGGSSGGGADGGPMLQARRELPIWRHRAEIEDGLRDGDVLLVVGETGSGKSTQVPQFLCRQPWCRRRTVRVAGEGEGEVAVGGIVAVTQPRRVAATTLAHRVAREMGTPLVPQGSGAPRRDGAVGYSVRFDRYVPKGVRIKFVTEGMLLQEMLRDPHLRQYSAVIVDEIHERSVDVDLIAGFLKQMAVGDKAGRGGIPLKMVIMSATADVERIQDFFSEPEPGPGDEEARGRLAVKTVHIEGRQYPVDVRHTEARVLDLQKALLEQIVAIHEQQPLPGDILAFLAGQESIEEAQARLEEYSAKLASDVPRLLVCPLYGQLSNEAQHFAFRPAPRFTRKIILATNIAETSVTVPAVSYVVDCGVVKTKQYRPQLGLESLLPKPITKSSAKQRAGRAGREGPGTCYRLYTEATYEKLLDPVPEILCVDILGAVLTMNARGVDHVLSFPLMDFPDEETVIKAQTYLVFLGALAADRSITKLGKRMAGFPVSAPYGKVLLSAAEAEYDCLLEAIDIIACLTAGENIFLRLDSGEAVDEERREQQEETEECRKELYRREGDLLTYLTTMQRYTAEHADRTAWCWKRRINSRTMKQALHIRGQLRALCLKEKMLREKPAPDPQPFEHVPPETAEAILSCFLTGFAPRIALLSGDGTYYTRNRQPVTIHPSSVLHQRQSWKPQGLMFIDYVYTTKSFAKRVSAIRAEWVIEALRKALPPRSGCLEVET